MNEGQTFTKKPVEIKAFPVNLAIFCATENWDGLPTWLADAYEAGNVLFLPNSIEINTLEGRMTASRGDWIIRGIQGELYSCKPDIFAETYLPKEDNA